MCKETGKQWSMASPGNPLVADVEKVTGKRLVGDVVRGYVTQDLNARLTSLDFVPRTAREPLKSVKQSS